MKDRDNIDTLIRSLDILGVQPEVDMEFKLTYKNSDYSEVNPSILSNEYDACLRYNDTHRNKIKSIYVICYRILYIDIIGDKDIHLCNDIVINFGHIIIKITISNVSPGFYIISIKKANESIPLLSYQEAYVSLESFVFHEKKSMVESFFEILGSGDPIHVQEYLRYLGEC